jgi:hypothetical protein
VKQGEHPVKTRRRNVRRPGAQGRRKERVPLVGCGSADARMTFRLGMGQRRRLKAEWAKTMDPHRMATLAKRVGLRVVWVKTCV